MKKCLRIVGGVLCSIAVLSVAVWYALSLLPLSPRGQMLREVMTQSRQYQEQMTFLLESVHDKASADAAAASYPPLVAREEAMPVLFMQYLWAQCSTMDKTALVREVLDTVSATKKNNELTKSILEPADGNLVAYGSGKLRAALDKSVATEADKLAVPQAVSDALLADTEQFLRDCAAAEDVRELYAAGASLMLRWNIWVAVFPDVAEMELSNALPRFARLADSFMKPCVEGGSSDVEERVLLLQLQPVNKVYEAYVKSEPERLNKLLTRLDALDALLLTLLERVNDAESAAAVEFNLQEVWQHRTLLFTCVRPVLNDVDRSSPERVQAEEVQQKIDERVNFLRQLPEPFYGNDVLREIFLDV